MLKFKSILSVPILIVCLYLLITLISCNKENPVVPPPPPVTIDTNDYYEWRFITPATIAHLFVQDTSHIYIFFPNGSCYRYDGANIWEPVNFNDPLFNVFKANTFDYKNIYFLGYTYNSSNYYPVTIKKYNNGNVIKSWISVMDSTGDSMNSVVTGEDDIWYGKVNKPYIYHLLSNSFTRYELDSGVVYNYVWKDKFNKIYTFGVKYYSTPPNLSYIMYSYKFNGNGFEKISKDTMVYTYDLFPCSSDLLIRTFDWGLSYFTGNNWSSIMNYPSFQLYKVGGWSKDSLISFGFESTPPSLVGFSPYFWNGKNWIRDKRLTPILPSVGYGGDFDQTIQIYEDHIYFTANFGNINNYLIIGKKNKNKKNYENKN